MDGVISDTQKPHSSVESELLGRYGVKISPEKITRKYAGVRTRDIIEELLSKQEKEYDIEEIIREKWERLEKLASVRVEEVMGAKKLIRRLYDEGFALAVGSASNKRYVNTVLEKLDVKKYFKEIVSGDMVKKGKPDPEIFLLAAEKLGISPEESLVIEDAVSGMQAAKNAGMYCIGYVKNKEKTYPTINLVSSLNDINSDYIKRLGK